MKKIFIGLVCILSSLFFTTNVYASSLNVSINGNTNFDSEITLNVQVNNLVDFTGSCNGLCGFVGNLEYDTNKIELVSISALNGFDLAQGNKIVLYKATGVGNGTNIMTMKFKNKSLANNESTNISFSNISVSDGDKDISTSNVSKTIKFVEEQKKKIIQITNQIMEIITIINLIMVITLVIIIRQIKSLITIIFLQLL